jgi:hypothetical protein
MSDERQKNQLVLGFMEESRSEAPTASVEGTESLVAKRQTESPAIGEQLMEEVCERENCKQALARVKANKGSAGVDGMTVQQLPEHLKQHWPAIREQLLNGTYEPQPVKRVEIPKPDGGVRKLGIPCITTYFRFVPRHLERIASSQEARSQRHGRRCADPVTRRPSQEALNDVTQVAPPASAVRACQRLRRALFVNIGSVPS